MNSNRKEFSVPETVSLILDSIADQHFSKCIELCSKLLLNDTLNISLRKNLQITYCRALLSLSKYNDVIEYCATLGQDSNGQQERNNLSLERFYALYKLGRYSESYECIEKELKNEIHLGDKKKCMAMKHLLAQCMYHLHETNMSIDMYTTMLGASDEADNCEILTNCLAALSSNISLPISSDTAVAVERRVEQELLASRQNSISYPYELAYNYASYQLLTSNSIRKTKQALNLLQVAEDECKAEMEQEDGKIVNAKNLMPIQANIALGKLQSGDWNGAFCTYIELTSLAKELLKIDNTFSGAGSILAAENNLTTMAARKGSSNLDVTQKLPDVSNDVLGSKYSGPKKTTPNQLRIILLNRALLLHKLSKTSEAKTVLACLRSSIDATMTNNGTKKKHKYTSIGIFDASPASLAEKIFWEVKISLLEAEMNRNDNVFSNLESIITLAMGKSDLSQTDKEILEFSFAEVKLYRCQKELQLHENRKKMTQHDVDNKIISVLESLPQSISRRPAIIATRYALYKSTGDVNKCDSILAVTESNQKRVADFKLRLGYYEEAAAIYKNILALEQTEIGKHQISEEEMLECRVGLIKALSYFDMDLAIRLSSEFDIINVEKHADGDELELMDVPRLNNTTGYTGRTVTYRGEKTAKKKDRSMESVLRVRSRKREAYLAKLQSEGKFNPDRPIKPDPERWIPKSQRSYNRRGRKVRNKFVGAQGGGTGVGAEKEASRLDVAARLAARAEGKESFSQFSTAHLAAVSSTSDRGGPKHR